MVQETLLYVISLLFAVMLLVILGQKLRIAYPVLKDLGEFLNKHLSSLRLQKLFDEDVICLEEGGIVLEQNKIG